MSDEPTYFELESHLQDCEQKYDELEREAAEVARAISELQSAHEDYRHAMHMMTTDFGNHDRELQLARATGNMSAHVSILTIKADRLLERYE